MLSIRDDRFPSPPQSPPPASFPYRSSRRRRPWRLAWSSPVGLAQLEYRVLLSLRRQENLPRSHASVSVSAMKATRPLLRHRARADKTPASDTPTHPLRAGPECKRCLNCPWPLSRHRFRATHKSGDLKRKHKQDPARSFGGRFPLLPRCPTEKRPTARRGSEQTDR